MRKILFVFFLWNSVLLSAQDIIYLNDGTKINGSINEITLNEIIYFVSETNDTTKQKVEIDNVQKIMYKDGAEEVFITPTNNKDIVKEPNTLVVNGYRVDLETFTDSRDGEVYRCVNIDNTRWMIDNLNYKVENSSKCFRNCTTCHELYTWEEAKELCPTGWELPSSADWVKLSQFVTTGTKWKYKQDWISLNINYCGYCDKKGKCKRKSPGAGPGGLVKASNYWGIDQLAKKSKIKAFVFIINEQVDNFWGPTYLSGGVFLDKENLNSVRCVKK